MLYVVLSSRAGYQACKGYQACMVYSCFVPMRTGVLTDAVIHVYLQASIRLALPILRSLSIAMGLWSDRNEGVTATASAATAIAAAAAAAAPAAARASAAFEANRTNKQTNNKRGTVTRTDPASHALAGVRAATAAATAVAAELQPPAVMDGSTPATHAQCGASASPRGNARSAMLPARRGARKRTMSAGGRDADEPPSRHPGRVTRASTSAVGAAVPSLATAEFAAAAAAAATASSALLLPAVGTRRRRRRRRQTAERCPRPSSAGLAVEAAAPQPRAARRRICVRDSTPTTPTTSDSDCPGDRAGR